MAIPEIHRCRVFADHWKMLRRRRVSVRVIAEDFHVSYQIVQELTMTDGESYPYPTTFVEYREPEEHELIQYHNFRLLPEHLRRLLEIRKRKRLRRIIRDDWDEDESVETGLS